MTRDRPSHIEVLHTDLHDLLLRLGELHELRGEASVDWAREIDALWTQAAGLRDALAIQVADYRRTHHS
jgi:hypothetical protein